MNPWRKSRSTRPRAPAFESTTVLRVGAYHSPPWVDLRDALPKGREIDLLGWVAACLDVDIEWTALDELCADAILDGEVDLMIGAIPAMPSLLPAGVDCVPVSTFDLMLGECHDDGTFPHVWLIHADFHERIRLMGLVLLYRMLSYWRN
jgi:hypothetical protein